MQQRSIRSKPDSCPLYLALDQGGSRSRAVVFDHRGQPLTQAEQAVATSTPQPSHIEQNPQQLADSLHQSAEAALQQLTDIQRQRVCCWGLACQRASLIGWDKYSGQQLTPVISWQDCRGQYLFDWNDKHALEINRRTGLPPSPHHGASKMRWCLEKLPEVQLAATQNRLQLAPLASYLTMALTRHPDPAHRPAPRVDASTAQRTLLWSIHSQNWDERLLSRFGIERSYLPATAPCQSDWGELRVAGLTLPGRFVGGDQGCAHLGSGTPAANTLKVNLGTGGFISLAVAHIQLPPPGLLLSLVTSDDHHQQWMLEGTIHGAGAALSWLQQQYPGTDLQPLFQQPLHPEPGLFLNAVSGLGSPFWRRDLNSTFINSDSLQQRYSALIDSIGFLIKIQLEQLQQAGYPIEQLELSGGLSKICGLAQRLADLSELPLQRHSDSQMTARGLAYLLANQPNHWEDKGTAGASRWFQPNPDHALQQRYRRWCEQLEQWLR